VVWAFFPSYTLFSDKFAVPDRVSNAAFGYSYRLSDSLNRHSLVEHFLRTSALFFVKFVSTTIAALIDQQSLCTALFICHLIPADRRAIQPKRSCQLGRLDRLGRTKNSLRKSHAVLIIFGTLENPTRGVQKSDFAFVVKNGNVIVDRLCAFGKQWNRHLKHKILSEFCCIPIYDAT
jgi:hypothetical protein